MSLMGRINARKGTGMMRGQPRRKLSLEGPSASFKEARDRVHVYNLSRTGMILETDAPLSVGEPIQVLLPEAGACFAVIVWANEEIYACQFNKPLSAATISAIRLQSPHRRTVAGPGEEVSGGDGGLEETLGQRLKRLRRERGLNMAFLASRVGVSKPTLWKWEKDTSCPRQEMVNALASVLGVSEMQILYGSKKQICEREQVSLIISEAAEELIVSSKKKIAESMGVDPSRVRVLIET
jgi:DNA-binding XRE family transcriptional regulator